MREMAKQLEEANPKYSANDAYNLANNIGEVFQYFEPATVHDFISEVVEKVVLHQEFIEIKLRPYGADIFENQLILLIDRRKQLIHIHVQIRLICRVKNNRNIRFPIGILAQQCQTGACI